ncbi:MAG: 4-hydroxy-3-methylbut-2-enyl diphosphate reductase [Verrucomicrobia bacterium]|nr:4-hydroxy-3-methylbut-2-enyl diphosphate reductase [Verrucomicrobiota bacterium]
MNEAETVAAPKKVNLRRPEIMEQVQAQVEQHYRSIVVEKLRASGNVLCAGGLTVRLAKQFGFCYGVERAIDLAYAARKVFKDKKLYILGEIIHNPEVNEQVRRMGIKTLTGENPEASLDDVTANDAVIIPAFGADVSTMNRLKAIGCQLVDTTCGDVLSVWKRVTQYASDQITSIIHGKAWHEETKATSSRALAKGPGHYLVVYNLEETDYVCDYIRRGGSKAEFLKKFEGAQSPGFDPDRDLQCIGLANQTTMLRSETEDVQHRLRQAVRDRYGDAELPRRYRFFDTICGATQERQDALEDLLQQPLDLMIVVGGYNSSNTSHLVEMSEKKCPTYFIKAASKIISDSKVQHFDLHQQKEIETEKWLPSGRPVSIGVTAGASCPNNLIEETIRRLFELRSVSLEELLKA